MKKTIFGLLTVTAAAVFTACGNNSESTASTDSTTTTETSTAATMQTSTKNYTAMADTFKTNSAAGVYLDPRSGKPLHITVNQSGALTDEASGQPIRRYVDKRTWWVYDVNTGDTIGSARMQGSSLRYRGDNDQWVSYDERWHDDMDATTSSTSSGDSAEISEGAKKLEGKDVKIKDDKVKIEGVGKMKLEKNGTVKEKKDD